MKLIIYKNQIGGNYDRFIRGAGYSYFQDRRSGKESYSRRLGRGIFPKFHMYIKDQGEKIVFDLHLDQKQVSYKGQNMHSGEYDGTAVEGEIERIFVMVREEESQGTQNMKHGTQNSSGISGKVGHGELPIDSDSGEKKKGWFRRLFS